MKFYRTPFLVRSFYNKLIWNFPNAHKKLFLTFDDGPQPELTDFILATLDTYDAKATFFCVGENLGKYPDLANKLLSAGHEIGNHTHNHLDGWKTRNEDYLKNVRLFEEEYLKVTSQKFEPMAMRPPYGKISRRQSVELRKKGYRIIMWDVLSYDFSGELDINKALKKIIKYTQEGSIAVFHDNIKAQKNLEYLLPNYLDYFAARGYSFPVISSEFN